MQDYFNNFIEIKKTEEKTFLGISTSCLSTKNGLLFPVCLRNIITISYSEPFRFSDLALVLKELPVVLAGVTARDPLLIRASLNLEASRGKN